MNLEPPPGWNWLEWIVFALIFFLIVAPTVFILRTIENRGDIKQTWRDLWS